MATRFSKCAYFKINSTDVTDYTAGVPLIRYGVMKQDLSTGKGGGTESGGDYESNGLVWGLYDDDADVVGSLLRPLHKKNATFEVQYGDPTTPGTAGTAKRDDIILKGTIFVELDSPVPAGSVGSAQIFTFTSDIQGQVEEDDGT